MDYKIETVQGLMNIISSLENNVGVQATMRSSRLFRGQSNFDWGLVPGVYRDNLFYSERLLINEALHRYPIEFENYDKFSALVKMQHYGLKTRLLDFTENPLVALYFACAEKNEDNDGALFILNNVATHYSNDYLVDIYVDYIFKFSGYESEEKELLNHFRNIKPSNYSRRKIESIDDLIYDLTLSGFCVYPKMNNSRLVSQQGVFFFCGMELEKCRVSKNPGTYGKKYYKFKPNIIKNESDVKIGGEIIKVCIAKEAKKNIIFELEEYYNINESTLFTDLEHQFGYLNKYVKEKGLFY